MDDRRAFDRYELGFGARVHTDRGLIPCSTRDISRGGCRLISDRPLLDGERIDIELCVTIEGFQTPDYPRLAVKAGVRWSTEGEDHGQPCYLAGIEFEALSEDKAAWLEGILQKNQGQYAKDPHGDSFEVNLDDL